MLVLEDHLDLIELISIVLRLGGFTSVGFAPSWSNAFSQIETRGPRFIMIDAEMQERRPSRDLVSRFESAAPRAIVVALSRLGSPRPRWAQAHLPRTDIAQLPALLKRLGRALPVDHRQSSQSA